MNFLHSICVASAVCLACGLSMSASADGQRQERSQRSKLAAPGAAADARLDLNTADVNALAAVPVIGPDVAQAIVAARPFKTVDDLDRVKDISAERLEQIRAVVTVSTAHVPAKLGSPNLDTPQPSGSDPRKKDKVDLNTADVKTLEAIPAIGAETARAIVAARPFATIDELNRVKGISAERLELIRAQVTVVPQPSATETSTSPNPKPVSRP